MKNSDDFFEKKIIIKKHAIDQYRNRTFSKHESTDLEIRNFLVKIAKKGEIFDKRPGENIYKVTHEGHGVIARITTSKIEIITYLGNAEYQFWYKRQKFKVKNRVGKGSKKSSLGGL